MNSIQNEMLEVLEDTVQYYSENPNKRGIDTVDTPYSFSFCLFKNKEGNKCAVGRYLNKKDLTYLEKNDKLSESLINFYNEKDQKWSFNFSTKIIKKLPFKFWHDLQNFHDNEDNWNVKGITSYGKRVAKSIENKILKGKYTNV